MKKLVILIILLFVFGCISQKVLENTTDNSTNTNKTIPFNESVYNATINTTQMSCTNYCSISESCKMWNVSGEYPNCYCLCRDSLRKINMIVRKWIYDPDPIYVKKNVPVLVNLTNIDESQEHGFYSPDFGINEMLKPNETRVILVIPNITGRITYYSSDDQSGYGGISGTMVVEN